MDIIEKIICNFKNNKSLYIGEKVTIAEHMIQSAMIAEKSKSKDYLVCSCLLHDYGHFILDDPDELVKENKDGRHEDIGYEYLKKFFKKRLLNVLLNGFCCVERLKFSREAFFGVERLNISDKFFRCNTGVVSVYQSCLINKSEAADDLLCV